MAEAVAETRERGLFEAAPVERPAMASQTLLSRIERCPYSGMLYLKHHGSVQTAAMARGEAFHAVIERITNMLIEQGEPECPPEVGKEIAQALMEERVDLALPTTEQEAVRTMAWNWCAATFLDLAHVVAVESMFEAEIGDWIVRGKIDRAELVGDELFVRDAKTSLAVPSQEEFERGFQGPFYGLIITEGHPEGDETGFGEGIVGVHVIEEYPRYRREDGDLVKRFTYLDRAQLFDFRRTVEAQLARLDHGLEHNEWAASPGSHCATCPCPAECPIPESLRGIRSIATPGEAAEVAERILFLDSEGKGLKASLKGYVEENGAVPAGSDQIFDLSYTESERADKDAIKELIRTTGHNIADFYKTVPSTRFGKRKLTKEERDETTA